jgi:hypothetical protein
MKADIVATLVTSTRIFHLDNSIWRVEQLDQSLT